MHAMKKVIVPEVKEKAEVICDVTGNPAVAKLTLWFGYGSDHDGEMLDVDLSCEAANEVWNLLRSKYPEFRLVEYFP